MNSDDCPAFASIFKSRLCNNFFPVLRRQSKSVVRTLSQTGQIRVSKTLHFSNWDRSFSEATRGKGRSAHTPHATIGSVQKGRGAAIAEEAAPGLVFGLVSLHLFY